MKKIFYFIMIFMGGGLTYLNLFLIKFPACSESHGNWEEIAMSVGFSILFAVLASKE